MESILERIVELHATKERPFCIHEHDHGIAWNNPIPANYKRAFWEELGCSCFAV
ncbi:MAG: hypothetical protein RIC14_10855 [Filomicrobium sp.]